MTPIDFAALGRLDAAATPAPWGVIASTMATRRDGKPMPFRDQYSLRTMVPVCIGTPAGDLTSLPLDIGGGLPEQDARAIAAARNAMPDLLAVVRAAARLRREEQMGVPNGTRVRRHRIALDAAISRFANLEEQP